MFLFFLVGCLFVFSGWVALGAFGFCGFCGFWLLWLCGFWLLCGFWVVWLLASVWLLAFVTLASVWLLAFVALGFYVGFGFGCSSKIAMFYKSILNYLF